MNINHINIDINIIINTTTNNNNNNNIIKYMNMASCVTFSVFVVVAPFSLHHHASVVEPLFIVLMSEANLLPVYFPRTEHQVHQIQLHDLNISYNICKCSVICFYF